MTRHARIVTTTLTLLVAASLAGCAAGPNPMTDTVAASGKPAGFLFGFWHGLICPIALVVSWFNPDVSIYEVRNTGGWYDTAFVLGAGAWGVLRGSGSKSRSRD